MPLDLNRLNASQPLVLREVAGGERVLTPDALAFVAAMDAAFSAQRQALLNARAYRQKGYDVGQLPELLSETKDIRQGVWTAESAPAALQDRRVEITGPVDRKMMLNALNSGAKTFMADFEDSSAPRFDTMVAGQVNMQDYRDNCLSFDDPKTGKHDVLDDKTAVLIMRPRGLHLDEANVLVSGRAAPAALFDFALHMFHNGQALHETGRGPFFYLPKLENHREARLWAHILAWTEEQLGLPKGAIKVTVLIETVRAAFEMDEIIWELRHNITGLTCDRWDYTFSYLKTMRAYPFAILPDRSTVTMDRGFLAHCAARLVKICHRRGIHAIGCSAAQLSVEGDPAKVEAALGIVRAEKQHEFDLGHDGTCVAHPALVPVAMEVFDRQMPRDNQIKAQRQYYAIEETKLLEPHKGTITEASLVDNLQVALEYLSNWICGHGAVQINGLVVDTATVEICRMQLWHWLHHSADVVCADGTTRCFDADWLSELLQTEVTRILSNVGPTGFHRGHYASALRILSEVINAETPPEFITFSAYEVLNALD